VDTARPRTIAIASGKGGTGKTTVAVNLAAVAEVESALVDCDVEEPNVHLFAQASWREESRVSVPIPSFDMELCERCGQCSEACRFNAIASLPSGPLLFPELCHSCGACELACPEEAISETPHEIGTIRAGRWRAVHVVEGRLDVGEPRSPPLIEAVRRACPNGLITIIDAPPGTSCAAVASVRGADFTLLVAEPTPFGLHDFRRSVAMLRQLDVRFAAVINCAGIGDDALTQYCRHEQIPILAEIPFDRRIAEAYSRAGIVVDELPEYRPLFQQLLQEISV
jgi:MinD superfamily P-loop ATPase